jgi:hypothetical protein
VTTAAPAAPAHQDKPLTALERAALRRLAVHLRTDPDVLDVMAAFTGLSAAALTPVVEPVLSPPPHPAEVLEAFAGSKTLQHRMIRARAVGLDHDPLERRRELLARLEIGRGHWCWVGDLDRAGRPVLADGTDALAVALALSHPRLPEGFAIGRLCDHPRCLRPTHLTREPAR